MRVWYVLFILGLVLTYLALLETLLLYNPKVITVPVALTRTTWVAIAFLGMEISHLKRELMKDRKKEGGKA